MADELNLFQKIAKVRGEVTGVTEDKPVGEGNNAYMATTHKEVNRVLRPLLAKYGLIDYVVLKQAELVDTGIEYGRTADRKRKLFQYRGEYDYVVVNADKPDETLSIPVVGWGEDVGDKAPGKSSTYAFKAGRTKLFSIAAEDDEEGRPDPDKMSKAADAPLTPEHFDALLALADELFGDDSEKTLTRMCRKVFQVEATIQIPDKFYEQATRLLQNQKKREEDQASAEPVSDSDSEQPGDDA